MNGNAKITSENLITMLVCPMTRANLIYDEETQELISNSAGVAYPIRAGVPVMLIEEARLLN